MTIEQIIEAIKNMTVLELNDLVKAFEEELKTEILSSIKNSQIEIRKEIENDIIPLINTKI